jgi:two-component system, OmpR family, sensor histidine kinase MtrB
VIRRTVEQVRQLGMELAIAWGAVWRRSLQLRVVISTLALSTAVVLVLGFVIQTQIAGNILQAKLDDAQNQIESGAALLERELASVDPNREGAQGELNNALDRLTNSSDASGSPAAGAFRAVLTTTAIGTNSSVSAGPLEDVPTDLRQTVADGARAVRYGTVDSQGVDVPALMIGQPVRTANGDLEFYLLFPLDSEQRTLGLVQSTLIVGGLVLLLLLAGIASIITRQVVRPVRRAAEIAERFADGHLDERLPVQGEDELARLGESYNEMAGSIQEQIRQLEEFGALQRRFTSDVSHELRTPLTTVRMAADLMFGERDDFAPEVARSAELLQNELDRFENLLTDLLEISRFDAGFAMLDAEPTDLVPIVERVVERLRGLAENVGVPLVVTVPSAAVIAEVDPRRVERILRNLVGNAVEHGECKPVEVTLDSDGMAAAVTVRDHGIGLKPGEEKLVFNRFWRADPSRARQTGGTGLGLSISLEDARLHGGWLEAWGASGRGAQFRLTLPVRAGDRLTASPLRLVPADGIRALPASPARAEQSGSRVLVGGSPENGRVVAHGADRDAARDTDSGAARDTDSGAPRDADPDAGAVAGGGGSGRSPAPDRAEVGG